MKSYYLVALFLFMQQIRNIPQKYLNIIFVFASLLVYNSIILYKYKNYGLLTRNYILAQFSFTYQKVGFISRGLVPSILELFDMNSKTYILIYFNIFIILYTYAILKILNLYSASKTRLSVIAFLFLFFGVPHFAQDAFRMDLVIQTICLFIFISLKRHQIIAVLILSIISMFVHEASIFLIIPILFISKLSTYKKISTTIFLSLLFILISIYSTKINEHYAIKLVQNYLHIYSIPKEIYLLHIQKIDTTFTNIFSTYNLSILILVGFIYIVILIFSFPKLFKANTYKFSFLVFFPLLLCLIAVDYYRWYCFMFFLAMIMYYNYGYIFTRKSFYILLGTTILLGIPDSINLRFGVLPLLLQIIGK